MRAIASIMTLLLIKLFCLVFCIPAYFLVLFAVWYDKKTSFGGKFDFKKESAYYWQDVKETLLAKRRSK